MARSQGVVSLREAEEMGLSLSPQPLLFPFSPLTPLGCCSCAITKATQAVKQAPCLAPDTFHTEKPPHLPRVNRYLSLLAPLVPPPTTLKLLLFPCTGGGQLLDQGVNVLGHFSPCSKHPFLEGREG